MFKKRLLNLKRDWARHSTRPLPQNVQCSSVLNLMKDFGLLTHIHKQYIKYLYRIVRVPGNSQKLNSQIFVPDGVQIHGNLFWQC